MIITHDLILGYVKIIVFQLIERIAIIEKSMKSVLGHCKNMLGFSYLVIPTRHEVHIKPYMREDNEEHKRVKPTKL